MICSGFPALIAALKTSPEYSSPLIATILEPMARPALKAGLSQTTLLISPSFLTIRPMPKLWSVNLPDPSAALVMAPGMSP